MIPTTNPSIQNPLKETYVKVPTSSLKTGDLVTYQKPKAKPIKDTGWMQYHCGVSCEHELLRPSRRGLGLIRLRRSMFRDHGFDRYECALTTLAESMAENASRQP